MSETSKYEVPSPNDAASASSPIALSTVGWKSAWLTGASDTWYSPLAPAGFTRQIGEMGWLRSSVVGADSPWSVEPQ